MISYAHKAEPKGSRFYQDKANPIPSWAVDVSEVIVEVINDWGLPSHPTDDFIYWNENNPVEKMKQLREVYDNIVEVVDPEVLKVLLVAAYESGRDDEHDANNPDLFRI